MVIRLFFLWILLYIFGAGSEMIIESSGISKVEPGDLGLIFYVKLVNVFSSDMYVSVRGVKCCQMKRDCKSMKLIGSDPGYIPTGKTKNVTLIYPNLFLYDRNGICTILVVYRTEKLTDHVYHQIRFETKSAPSKCETKEVEFVEMFPHVDCPIKYSGCFNYFNEEENMCEKVPICKYGTYNLLDNTCEVSDCSVTIADIRMLSNNQKEEPKNFPISNGNIMCHHGDITDCTSQCVCRYGWISFIDEHAEFFPSVISTHMCNIRAGSWIMVNSDKILMAIVVIITMVCLVIIKLIVFGCLLHLCYKWMKKREKGRISDIQNEVVIYPSPTTEERSEEREYSDMGLQIQLQSTITLDIDKKPKRVRYYMKTAGVQAEFVTSTESLLSESDPEESISCRDDIYSYGSPAVYLKQTTSSTLYDQSIQLEYDSNDSDN